MTTSLQGQIQSLRENASKLVEERNALKKEVETRTHEIQEKVQTITQVRKIGRRYKSQYDELKVQHDKVRAWSPKLCFVRSHLLGVEDRIYADGMKTGLVRLLSYRWLPRLRQAQLRTRRRTRLQSRNCRAYGIL